MMFSSENLLKDTKVSIIASIYVDLSMASEEVECRLQAFIYSYIGNVHILRLGKEF